MPGVSKTTEALAVRLPKEVAEKAKANAKRQGVSVSEYLAKILVLQVTRKR